MNKITTIKIGLVVYCLCTFFLTAQTDYTYTFIDNGNYSFTVSAVPETNTSNFPTSVQSYGFTIIVPDGVTASITSSLGNGASATFFEGNNVGNPSIDGYLITETLGSPIALPAPSAGTFSPMVTIQVAGMPSNGIIEILANDSALATAVNPLKSFLTADTTDDGSANFGNTIDANGSGLSGTSSYDFATLSVNDALFEQFTIYPNPATDYVFINTQQTQIEQVSIYSISGQLVNIQSTNLEKIDVRSLQKGIYLVKIDTKTASKTIKLIRQ